jgi:hypothetical protein|tara:strand:- start:393 stop:533 length:141 start_codon:yes stop_codon:yes gene_type:complete
MLATSWHIQKVNPQKTTKAITRILIINFMIQNRIIPDRSGKIDFKR